MWGSGWSFRMGNWCEGKVISVETPITVPTVNTAEIGHLGLNLNGYDILEDEEITLNALAKP